MNIFSWFGLAPKNVGEPVISFVKCVKNNPSRFRVFNAKTTLPKTGRANLYLLKDRVTKEQFGFSMYKVIHIWETSNWLSKEEEVYLCEQLYPLFYARQERLNQIKQFRKGRVINKEKNQERQRLIKLYC